MKKTIIISLITAIVFGALGFGGGVLYQKSKTVVSNVLSGNQNRRFSQNNMMNNRPIVGEVIDIDDKGTTLKLADGSSKIILFSQNMSVVESTSASKSALMKGKQILVIGSTNSDGSITAQSIQLNPANGFGRRMGSPIEQ